MLYPLLFYLFIFSLDSADLPNRKLANNFFWSGIAEELGSHLINRRDFLKCRVFSFQTVKTVGRKNKLDTLGNRPISRKIQSQKYLFNKRERKFEI